MNPDEPLPLIGNGSYCARQQNNSEVIAILMDAQQLPNGAPTVNAGHRYNPQKLAFFTPKAAPSITQPGLGPDGVYRDPWGNPYIVSLDLNYDNKTRDGAYRMAAVSGSARNRTGLVLPVTYGQKDKATDPNSYEANAPAMVWSFGPDGRADPTAGALSDPSGRATVNRDNVLSW